MMVPQLASLEDDKELYSIFRLLDHDNTGTIGVQNLERIGKEFQDGTTQGEMLAMIREFSHGRSEEMSLEDFMEIVKRGPAISYEEEYDIQEAQSWPMSKPTSSRDRILSFDPAVDRADSPKSEGSDEADELDAAPANAEFVDRFGALSEESRMLFVQGLEPSIPVSQ